MSMRRQIRNLCGGLGSKSGGALGVSAEAGVRRPPQVLLRANLLHASNDDAGGGITPVIGGSGEVPDAVYAGVNVDEVNVVASRIKALAGTYACRSGNVRAQLVVCLGAGIVCWRIIS